MSDRPRLLQIGKHFPPDTGGIETLTLALSELFADRGIVADVLATQAGPAVDEPTRRYSIKRMPNMVRWGNKGLSPAYLAAIGRASPRYDLAIVHLPNPVAVAGVLAFWRKPAILFWHADIPQRPIRLACRPFDARLIARAAATVVLTPAHVDASHLAQTIRPRVRVIGYPLMPGILPSATGTSTAAARARTFLQGRRLLLSIGRLVPYKGYDVLVAAVRDMPRDIAVIIVGDGPDRAALARTIAQAGVGDRVLMMHDVDDAGRSDLLAAAWAGCLPSITRAEMYGISQVEMMAFGKPVVATRIAGSGVGWINRDGESGLLAEPGDPAALAAAVRRLVDEDGLHARLSTGAAAAFRRNNDPAAIGDRWMNLVQEALRGS